MRKTISPRALLSRGWYAATAPYKDAAEASDSQNLSRVSTGPAAQDDCRTLTTEREPIRSGLKSCAGSCNATCMNRGSMKPESLPARQGWARALPRRLLAGFWIAWATGCVPGAPSHSSDDASGGVADDGATPEPGDADRADARVGPGVDGAEDAGADDAQADGAPDADSSDDAQLDARPNGDAQADADLPDASSLAPCDTDRITVSAPIMLPAQSASHAQYHPVPLFDGTKYLLVWEERLGGALPAVPRAMHVSATGVPLDVPFTISVPQDVLEVFEAGYDGTNFVVAWTNWPHEDEPSPTPTVSRMSPAGVILDTTGVALPCDSTTPCEGLRVVCSQSNCLLMWLADQRVMAARYREGVLLDSPQLVASSAAGFSSYNAGVAGGDYLLMWSTTGERGSATPIQRVRVDATTGALSVEEPIPGSAFSNYYAMQIASDGDRTLVVWPQLWADFSSVADQVVGVRMGRGGVVEPSPFLLAPRAPQQGVPAVYRWDEAQGAPGLTFDGQHWITAWTKAGNLMATRVFRDGGNDWAPTLIEKSAGGYGWVEPRLATNGRGQTLVVYQEYFAEASKARARILTSTDVRCRTCGELASDPECTGPCLPGTSRCTPGGPQICGADAIWTPAQACAATEICTTGSGIAACKERCSPGATRCDGRTRQICDNHGTWQSSETCSAQAQYCAAQGCSAVPPSCQVTAQTCGAGSSESCCTALPVSGGTFFRKFSDTGSGPYDFSDSATVSSFVLDKFDVTVGRFRQFVQASSLGHGYRPAPGAGKHVHVHEGRGLADFERAGLYEPGWLMGDDIHVAPTDENLACGGAATWTSTPGANEQRPINCINFYEAFAFCIWDGGFLPSDSELLYASVGGSEHRIYPWGATPPGRDNQYAIYDCLYPYVPPGSYGPGAGPCTGGVENIAAVGTPALGAGRWGQLDLNGNVEQLVLDWLRWRRPACTDCASLLAEEQGLSRAFIGSSYFGDDYYSFALEQSQQAHYGVLPTRRSTMAGFRCARAPL